jgi:murein DD-endopeptidase MepM/ murein hydrolase activator NlpD
MGLLVLGASIAIAAQPIRVSYRSRSLQPGELAVLNVEAPGVIDGGVAEVFGKTFPLFRVGDDNVYEGLIGIDLNLDPGTYTMKVRGRLQGEPFEQSEALAVKPKNFPVRRITVDEKFANPPADVMKRIEREQAMVTEIISTTTPRRYWEGTFTRPVPGAASSSFGKRSVVNGQARSPHSGTDFKASAGTPIHAPNAGMIALAEELYFAGNTVIIDHGLGLYTYFAHLSKFDVKKGDRVNKGDLVGLVGSTGRVTGPHLHWTARLVGTRIDPLSILEMLGDPGANEPSR